MEVEMDDYWLDLRFVQLLAYVLESGSRELLEFNFRHRRHFLTWTQSVAVRCFLQLGFQNQQASLLKTTRRELLAFIAILIEPESSVSFFTIDQFASIEKDLQKWCKLGALSKPTPTHILKWWRNKHTWLAQTKKMESWILSVLGWKRTP